MLDAGEFRDDIKVRSRRNAVQARKLSDMLTEAINKYANRPLTTMQVIEHLIEFAKELREEPKRAEEIGLSEDEPAFYDALVQTKSALDVLGVAQLRAIAHDLVSRLRETPTIDRNLHDVEN
jgi:type I restriction enzyme R subunit